VFDTPTIVALIPVAVTEAHGSRLLEDEPLDDEPLDDEPLDDEPLDDEPLDDEPLELNPELDGDSVLGWDSVLDFINFPRL